MTNSLRNRPFQLAVLVLGVLLQACSGGDEQAAPASEVIDLREPTVATLPAAESTRTDRADTEVEIITEPARRVEVTASIDASNWIGRTFMDSSSVELVWSPVEGADNYRLFRLPTANADYDEIDGGVIVGADEIYDGPDFGFIDVEVPTGAFLTYVVVAEVGDETTEPRWTEALTLDDVTPPAPILGLAATETDEGVLLEWEPSSDDVEFAAYSVSILEEGELRYIGGGADVGQVSFLDDEEFVGTRSYVVAAVDFHDNVSETAQVDVTR